VGAVVFVVIISGRERRGNDMAAMLEVTDLTVRYGEQVIWMT
jgi:hypothetical protein